LLFFNRNLSGNNLSGPLPQGLRREGLELLVQGNPRLCLSGSCTEKNSKKKFPVVIVASVASVAIIVAVLVIIFVLSKKKSSTVGGNLQEISHQIKKLQQIDEFLHTLLFFFLIYSSTTSTEYANGS
jgi:hypothetical protein